MTDVVTAQTHITRFELLDVIIPHCEPDYAALMYRNGNDDPRPGWVKSGADASRAIDAYRRGKLATERFASSTKDGTPYEIHDAIRLGLVPHRDGLVRVICADLDDHTGDGGNVNLLEGIARFFGARPIVFTSKGGKGLHCFLTLAEPIAVGEFVRWAKAWGFNRRGGIELFPKTEKLTQVWLPNEPNENGGDTYVSGTLESWIVRVLPPATTAKLTTATLDFLRGFVTKPGRNDALYVAARELREKGVTRQEAWRLCRLGADLCGLEAEEPEPTRTSFNSGFDTGASEKVEVRSGSEEDLDWMASLATDVGNGARLARRYRDEIRFCHAIGKWYIWDGKRWRLDDRGRIVRLCTSVALSIFDEAKAAPDDDARDRLGKWAVKSQSRNRLTAMAALAQSHVPVTTDELDRDIWLCNCLNGTVYLKTGELRLHHPGDLITKLAPVIYDPEAKCPLFEKFLKEIFDGDQSLIRYVQRWLGYCLSGDITHQLLPIFHGEGQNGKNVLLDTVSAAMGDYAGEAPPELLTVRKHQEHPTEIADLFGLRLAVASETECEAELRLQLVKRLTGNAKLKGRKMRQDYFEFPRTHKLILVTNNLPVVKEDTGAVWRRLRVVPFTVVIPAHKRDNRLLKRLEAEHAGILAWLVRGCVDCLREGLTEPSAVTQATEDLRYGQNSLIQFLRTGCTLADGVVTLTSELIEAYEKWCGEHDAQPLKRKAFAALMEKKGCQRRKMGGQWHWVGVEVRAPEIGGSGHHGHHGHELPHKPLKRDRSWGSGQPTSMMSLMSSDAGAGADGLEGEHDVSGGSADV